MGNIITLFVIMLVVVIALVICFFVLQAVRNSRKIAELGATASFDLGRYLGGLPGNALPTAREASTKCAVTASDFVFIVFGSALGRVPRDAVASTHLDDHGEHLCYLTIDWQDERAVQQQTVFEFSGSFARILANAAAEQLQKYVKPRVRLLAPG